jgi:urease accessory protein
MSLRYATIHRRAGNWPHQDAAGVLTLDFDARHRRRILLTTDQREEFLLDLPKAVSMADGDGLQLSDGRWLKVRAAAEPVVEVRHQDCNQLLRLAWHLGNRHVALEIRNETLRMRPDHVLESMLEGLGAELLRMHSPFQPERGAYHDQDAHHGGAGHRHGH